MASNKKHNQPTVKVEPVEEVINEAVETNPETIDAVEEDKKTPKPAMPKKEFREDAKSSSILHEGTVYNCMKLNVRNGPSKDTPVLYTITAGSKIVVKDTDNNEWYKIPGQGYVMKKFVSLR